MQRMFEVGHGGEEGLTFSGDDLPEGESAIVIGQCALAEVTRAVPSPADTCVTFLFF